MESEALHARREARRRALRRRRQAAGLIALVIAAVAILVASRSGGTSGTPGHSTRPARSSTGPGDSGGRRTGERTSATAAPVRSGTVPVPILMYHVIAAPPAGAPFPGLYVTPSEFAAQMQALKNAGWQAVTLDQVEADWRRGVAPRTGKPIVLSFDNGYQSQYTQALPVLRRLGWVGDENIQLTGLPPSQGGLGGAEIRGLLNAGWELDTQGFSHADLIALDSQAAALPGRRRTDGAPAALPHPGELVLLPLRPLRRHGDRRREGRRLRGLHHGRPRVGPPSGRPLPNAPATGARRHHPRHSCSR